MHTHRLDQLTKALKKVQTDSILISEPASISYFIENQLDPGERLILLQINQNTPHHLYWNRLFPVPTLPEALEQAIQIHYYNDGETIIETIAQQLKGQTCSVDKYWPSQFLLALMQTAPQVKFVNQSFLVDDLRAIKSDKEQAIMAKASELNDQATIKIQEVLKQRLSETQMIDELARIYQELGCDGFSFEPIIAYGANCANPHHETSQDKPQMGDSIVVDIGSRYQGYCSDMTRTFFFGEIDEESRQVYELVKAANQAAIDLIKPGVTFAQIDAAARDLITAAGYGEYFTHRTGHFIGREVHEAGDVSSFNNKACQVGQVFSIEPGIYLPGKVGVRIEDLVIVTEEGCQVLNKVSKDLTIIQPSA